MTASVNKQYIGSHSMKVSHADYVSKAARFKICPFFEFRCRFVLFFQHDPSFLVGLLTITFFNS